MKNINKNYVLFNDKIRVTDIIQGKGGTCYMFSALASIVNHPEGESFIRGAFEMINKVSFFIFNKIINKK